MKILVVNAGSSSLKYAVIDTDATTELAEGLVERIGLEGTRLKAAAGDRKSECETPDVTNAAEALGTVARELVSGPTAIFASLDEIDAAGHRLGYW